MTLKMWVAQLDTRPYLRCLGTSALAITSRREQLHGHGSWQLRNMGYLQKGCGLVLSKIMMKHSTSGTMSLLEHAHTNLIMEPVQAFLVLEDKA